MKKRGMKAPGILLCAALVIAALLCIVPEAKAMSGNGTESSPYQIATAADLCEFRDIVNGINGKTANPGAWGTLTADIDMNGVTWTPIGTEAKPFTGVFSGFTGEFGSYNLTNMLYKIKNLSASGDYFGLFGWIGSGGRVQYVNMSGGSFGGYGAGSIAGCNFHGTVQYCMSSAGVSGSNAGGIVGENYGSIQNCYNTGNISGSGYLGGIAGGCFGPDDPSVSDCYNSGTVQGTGDCIGGIAGYTLGPVSGCTNTGTISGNVCVGGIVGQSTSRGAVSGGSSSGTITGIYEVGLLIGINSGTIQNAVNVNIRNIDCGRGRISITPKTENNTTSITLTATPDEGYSFVNWGIGTGGATEVTKANPYTFTLTDHRTLWAKFNPLSYSVTLNVNGGTVNSGNVTEYTYTVGATLPTDVTKTNLVFAGWYDNAQFTGDPVTAISATDTGNKEYWAKWNGTVTTLKSPDEGGTVSGGGDYQQGSLAAVTAVPATGYSFKEWQKDGDCVSTEASYSFSVSENVTLTAVFEMIPAEKPILSGPSGLTYAYGQEGSLSVTATPADGHTITGYQWYVNTKDSSTTGGEAVQGATEATCRIPADRNAGTAYYYCTVTATRTDNQLTAEKTSDAAKVVIEPRSITGATVTLDRTQLTYNGSEQTVNVTGVTVDSLALTPEDYEVSGNSGKDKGDYTVTVTGKGNFTGSATAEWSIVEKAMTVEAPNVTAPYDGQPHGITVTVTDPADGATVAYGTEEGTCDLTASPAITDAGTLTVYYRVTAANYTDYSGVATVTVTKGDPAVVVTPPSAVTGLVCTGEPLALITAGTAEGGEMQYATGTADAATEPYTASIPTGTDAGTYYVWYMAKGDGNHADSAAACVTAVIAEPEPIPDPEPDEPITSGGVLLAKVTAKGNNKIEVSWNKIRKAEGYDLYYGRCDGENQKVRVVTIPAGQTSYTLKKLKAGKGYKCQIKAWVLKDGEKKVISRSRKVRCVTAEGKTAYTHEKSVRVDQKELKIAAGGKAKITAQVIKDKPGKKLMPFMRQVRYISGNSAVATVDKDGKVRGVKAGTCKIYAIARNGVYKSVSVTVGEAPTSLRFRKKAYKVGAGSKLNLKKELKFAPEGAFLTLKWKSSDPSIATVDKNGRVKGISKGEVTISVTDTVLKMTIEVLVKVR